MLKFADTVSAYRVSVVRAPMAHNISDHDLRYLWGEDMGCFSKHDTCALPRRPNGDVSLDGVPADATDVP